MRLFHADRLIEGNVVSNDGADFLEFMIKPVVLAARDIAVNRAQEGPALRFLLVEYCPTVLLQLLAASLWNPILRL